MAKFTQDRMYEMLGAIHKSSTKKHAKKIGIDYLSEFARGGMPDPGDVTCDDARYEFNPITGRCVLIKGEPGFIKNDVGEWVQDVAGKIVVEDENDERYKDYLIRKHLSDISKISDWTYRDMIFNDFTKSINDPNSTEYDKYWKEYYDPEKGYDFTKGGTEDDLEDRTNKGSYGSKVQLFNNLTDNQFNNATGQKLLNDQGFPTYESLYVDNNSEYILKNYKPDSYLGRASLYNTVNSYYAQPASIWGTPYTDIVEDNIDREKLKKAFPNITDEDINNDYRYQSHSYVSNARNPKGYFLRDTYDSDNLWNTEMSSKNDNIFKKYVNSTKKFDSKLIKDNNVYYKPDSIVDDITTSFDILPYYSEPIDKYIVRKTVDNADPSVELYTNPDAPEYYPTDNTMTIPTVSIDKGNARRYFDKLHKNKGMANKGLTYRPRSLDFGKKEVTRLIPRLIQKATGYDKDYMEGYEDEEGNHIPGEIENAQTEGRQINFKGRSSLDDKKAQEAYNQEWIQYQIEKDLIKKQNIELLQKYNLPTEKYLTANKKYGGGLNNFAEGGALNKFVGGGNPTCPKDYKWNPETNRCEKKSGCPENFHFDPKSGRCISNYQKETVKVMSAAYKYDKNGNKLVFPTDYDDSEFSPVSDDQLDYDKSSWPKDYSIKGIVNPIYFVDHGSILVSAPDYVPEYPGDSQGYIETYPDLNYKVVVDSTKPEGYNKDESIYYVKSENTHQFKKYKEWEKLKKLEKDNIDNAKKLGLVMTEDDSPTSVKIQKYPEAHYKTLKQLYDDEGNDVSSYWDNETYDFKPGMKDVYENDRKTLQELYNDPEYLGHEVYNKSFDETFKDRGTKNIERYKALCPHCRYYHGQRMTIDPDYIYDSSNPYQNPVDEGRFTKPFYELENEYADPTIESMYPKLEFEEGVDRPDYYSSDYDMKIPTIGIGTGETKSKKHTKRLFNGKGQKYSWTSYRPTKDLEFGTREVTRLIPRMVQKATGYDRNFMEGYEDKEGNYFPGEIEKAEEEGRQINFKGANSLRDRKQQKIYNEKWTNSEEQNKLIRQQNEDLLKEYGLTREEYVKLYGEFNNFEYGGLQKFIVGGASYQCPTGEYWNGVRCVPNYGINPLNEQNKNGFLNHLYNNTVHGVNVQIAETKNQGMVYQHVADNLKVLNKRKEKVKADLTPKGQRANIEAGFAQREAELDEKSKMYSQYFEDNKYDRPLSNAFASDNTEVFNPLGPSSLEQNRNNYLIKEIEQEDFMMNEVLPFSKIKESHYKNVEKSKGDPKGDRYNEAIEAQNKWHQQNGPNPTYNGGEMFDYNKQNWEAMKHKFNDGYDSETKLYITPRGTYNPATKVYTPNRIGYQSSGAVEMLYPEQYAIGAMGARSALIPLGEMVYAKVGASALGQGIKAAWNTALPYTAGQLTVGNSVGLGFGMHGATTMKPNLDKFIAKPSWEAGLDLGISTVEVLGSPGVGKAIMAGVKPLIAVSKAGFNGAGALYKNIKSLKQPLNSASETVAPQSALNAEVSGSGAVADNTFLYKIGSDPNYEYTLLSSDEAALLKSENPNMTNVEILEELVVKGNPNSIYPSGQAGQQAAFEDAGNFAINWAVKDTGKYNEMLANTGQVDQLTAKINRLESSPIVTKFKALNKSVTDEYRSQRNLTDEEFWVEYNADPTAYKAFASQKWSELIANDPAVSTIITDYGLYSKSIKGLESKLSIESENVAKLGEEAIDPIFKEKVIELYRQAGIPEHRIPKYAFINDGKLIRDFDISRSKLVDMNQFDPLSEPSFAALSAEDQMYLANNWKDIGGARTQDATITIGSRVNDKTYYTVRKLGESQQVLKEVPAEKVIPWKPSTWKNYNAKPKNEITWERPYVEEPTLVEKASKMTHDADYIAEVQAHEYGHDTEMFYSDWGALTTEYDPTIAAYSSHSKNPLAKRFKDAMVEGKPFDPVTGKRVQGSWESSPNELHAELFRVRFKYYTKMAAENPQLSQKEIIKFMKEAEAADNAEVYDFYLKELSGHFKESTPITERKNLIKLLPALVPAISVGVGVGVGVGTSNGTNSETPQNKYGGNIKTLSKFIRK